MRLSREDIPDIIRPLDDLAKKEGYSKIFLKVPESSAVVFEGAGYIVEVSVPFFYHGTEAAVFMAKYFDPERKQVNGSQEIADVLSAAFGYTQSGFIPRLPAGFSLMHAHSGDAKEIATLFRSIFRTYPFPIGDPDFITGLIKEGVRYFCIHQSKRIAAVSSCEINAEAQNAEMTDFATDPRFQGKGLANILLHAMETEMRKEDVKLAYTLARATSYAINITFARAGYEYGGILPNNTNICGSMESMNVWYKKL